MATNSQRKLQKQERRMQVAELHKKGWSQAAIAERLGVTQPTVSSDLKYIREEWRRSMVRDFDLARAQELQRVDRIECEANEGWDRSLKPSQSAVIQGEGAQQPSRKTVRNQSGDPRFLDILLKCSERRSKLLGLDAPQKVAPTDTEGRLLDLSGILGLAAEVPSSASSNVIDVESELARDALLAAECSEPVSPTGGEVSCKSRKS